MWGARQHGNAISLLLLSILKKIIHLILVSFFLSYFSDLFMKCAIRLYQFDSIYAAQWWWSSDAPTTSHSDCASSVFEVAMKVTNIILMWNGRVEEKPRNALDADDWHKFKKGKLWANWVSLAIFSHRMNTGNCTKWNVRKSYIYSRHAAWCSWWWFADIDIKCHSEKLFLFVPVNWLWHYPFILSSAINAGY